jgi:hypothetical protein
MAPRKSKKRVGNKKTAGNILAKKSPKKRKKWSNTSMVEAMEAVRKGSTSINRAAVTFGVPRTTLKDLSGRVLHGTKPGPQCYLDKKEEALLADHLVEAAQIGYGKTRKEVKSIVVQVAKEKAVNRSNRVSDGWWRRFLERQPQLSLRRGDATTHIRMDATNLLMAVEKRDCVPTAPSFAHAFLLAVSLSVLHFHFQAYG